MCIMFFDGPVFIIFTICHEKRICDLKTLMAIVKTRNFVTFVPLFHFFPSVAAFFVICFMVNL